jgi:hypothetical protein
LWQLTAYPKILRCWNLDVDVEDYCVNIPPPPQYYRMGISLSYVTPDPYLARGLWWGLIIFMVKWKVYSKLFASSVLGVLLSISGVLGNVYFWLYWSSVI